MFLFLAIKPISMKTVKLLIILFWIIPLEASIAQVVNTTPAFESVMLCSSAAIPKELNGFVQNPAAASFNTTSGFSLFQQSFPSLNNLTLNSVSYKQGKIIQKGFNLTQFGTSFYRIFSAQMVLSSKLNESLAIGVLTGLNAFPTEEVSPNFEPSFGLGLCWKPYKNWSYGLTYLRPIRALQQINIAATWTASTNLEWSFAFQKIGIYPQSIKSGLRYRFREDFYFLIGLGISPNTNAFGILFPFKKVNLGIGAQLLDLAGWQACFTLHYPI